MFIIIKDNYQIYKYNLSDCLIYKGIEIYFKNGQYYINLKENYYFNDDTKSDILKLKKYEVINKDVYYSIDIYVYELDLGIDDYKLYENQKVLIANSDKANIISNDYYLNDYYLYLDQGYIKSNFEVSVNESAYTNYKLVNGDIIDYLGIRIIYFEEYLYINSFNVDVRIKEYEPHLSVFKYPDINNVPNYYLPIETSELVIEPIEMFEAPKKSNSFDFVKSVIPNIIMSLSMICLAIISLYTNTSQNSVSKVSYILMPISMLATGVLLPIIFYCHEAKRDNKAYTKAKNKYLDYLKDYKDKLVGNINKYVASYNERFFDVDSARQRMFYATNKSLDFLTLSLGKVKINREIDYKLSGDKDIDDELLSINNITNNIEDFPLFISIAENPIITVVSKRSDKFYFFNKFLLELSYKHHYDDIGIAIYCKQNSTYDYMFNLPHLFFNNKRLTLSSDRQLQELDQSKFNKPIVLFIYDQLDYVFTNPNIYIIYFSIDNTDLYKNSSCVIEYLNTKAYLYKDKKLEFSYIQKNINYLENYNYLGKLKSFTSENKHIHFKDILSFDIKRNYLNSNNTLECSFAYSNNELLYFDLHESKQGPHGLIGGSTGSGKSELIVSLLLSLCIRYAPDYLNIVLIDYKGGGLKESLSYNGICVPHVVASVTNLENNSLERLIISLNNECKYRQELFKAFSSVSNSSIMNIDDYLSNGYQKYGFCKLAHLLIVVDEFAQLKKENPEQIKELIALSRIGRSLGLHLILATQKPSGVIDEEIWSNSRFKIALKVFDEKDSIDIIKKKDAAYLRQAGSFLLQVDDSLIKAQAIYSKYDINGNDPYKVCLLDNCLNVISSYCQQATKTISEASVYCKKIIETSEELGLVSKPIEFLPEESKCRKQLTDSECLVFGESDDYINSKRSLVAYDIKESVLVYSSRQEEINSFLNTFNEFKRHIVVIGNRVYKGAYISDSILYDDSEGINYLLDFLLNNKNLDLTLVIEDINCLLSYDENYLDKLCRLCRRHKTSNLSLFFITTNSQISFKLINYFDKKVLIRVLDKSDVSFIFNCRSNYQGHSYYYTNEPISMIEVMLEKYVENDCLLKPIIKRIPDCIKPNIVSGKYLLGYDLSTKEEVYGDDDVLIFSIDQALLDRYNNYSNIKKVLYNYELKIDMNKSILWLGAGIFNQRLFIASYDRDLTSEQGLYMHKGNKYLLRSINDV